MCGLSSASTRRAYFFHHKTRARRRLDDTLVAARAQTLTRVFATRHASIETRRHRIETARAKLVLQSSTILSAPAGARVQPTGRKHAHLANQDYKLAVGILASCMQTKQKSDFDTWNLRQFKFSHHTKNDVCCFFFVALCVGSVDASSDEHAAIYSNAAAKFKSARLLLLLRSCARKRTSAVAPNAAAARRLRFLFALALSSS